MKEQELNGLWAQFSAEIDSLKSAIEISEKQRRSDRILGRLKLRRIAEAIVFGLLSVILMGYMAQHISDIWVFLSAFILNIFCLIGAIGSILQIASILKMNFSIPVTQFQQQLAELRLYNLASLKLIFASVPFFMAYIVIWADVFAGINIVETANTGWLISNLSLSFIFLGAYLWFARELKHNSRIAWIRALIRDNGGREIDEVEKLM